MADDVPLEMPSVAEPAPKPPQMEPVVDREFDQAESFRIRRENDHLAMAMKAEPPPPPPRFEPAEEKPSVAPMADPPEKEAEEDPFARIGELMMQEPVEPIPDLFASHASPQPRAKRGSGGLWFLLFILVVGSLAAALYYFQDWVIDEYPAAAPYYQKLGLRNEVVGAGLIFRNYNSERVVQDNAEVLIVRGVIANTTGQPREIPSLRLALYEGTNQLQEKIVAPPQPRLDAQATVGFRITLDQPNPNASRFEVTFAQPKPAAKP